MATSSKISRYATGATSASSVAYNATCRPTLFALFIPYRPTRSLTTLFFTETLINLNVFIPHFESALQNLTYPVLNFAIHLDSFSRGGRSLQYCFI